MFLFKAIVGFVYVTELISFWVSCSLLLVAVDSDTLMAARSQPNDNWGSVGNGAKHGEKHVGGGSSM